MLINLLILLFTSCSSSLIKGYKKEGTFTVGKEQIPSFIENSGELARYHMTIDFRKKYFSGLLIMKRTGEESYRFLFSTHFGMTLMEFDLTKDTIQVYDCIEPLQRKQLYKLLQQDFSLLLGLNRKKYEPAIRYLPNETAKYIAYKLTDSPGKGYYLVSTDDSLLYQAEVGKGLRKTFFCLLPDVLEAQKQIRLNHCRIGLTLTLQTL